MSLEYQQKLVVLDWMRKLHTLEYAHRYASVSKERLNLFLGVPVVVLSASIGAQMGTPWHDNWRTGIAVGLAASFVAMLASLQTFFKPTEIAEKHRSASAAYEAFRHRLEFLLTFDTSTSAELSQKLDRLKAEWERFETPNVSMRAWTRAKKTVTQVGTYPESLRLSEVAVNTSGNQPSKMNSPIQP